MPSFQVVRDIAASRATVWSVLADFGNIADWSGNVKESHLVSAAKEGAGMERFCDFGMGMNVREQVAKWDVEKELGIKFTKFTMSAENPTAVFRLSDAPGGTRVQFTMSYEPKGFAKVMSAVMKRQMQGNLETLLDDLKAQSEKLAVASAPA